ncbi:MAG TPA: kynureninase [Thermoanaerobaculia bacterium]|nr:kynureninase [Thermoanaerobaculia bacterium]
MITRTDALRLDAADPLARFRDRFEIPDGLAYLDGNSLGALPKGVAQRVADAVSREWGEGLVRSWNDAGWIDLPRRVGDRIARLVGAGPGEVVCTDSTSVNVFKVLSAALALRPGRSTILSEEGNFPTDLYMAEGLARLLDSGHRLRLVAKGDVLSALDADVAVLLLTHVDYRTGERHDLETTTRSAHEAGALVAWDLAHSAGAMPVDLAAAGADFAVGCGYKYLCGGPGAPAFLYVAPRHQQAFVQPLSGWLGHAEPFAFEPGYRPAEGISRFLCGTPPILSMTALDAALDVILEADLALVREKSEKLTSFFVEAVEQECAGAVRLVSPRDPSRRGSQVSFAHPDGYAVIRALVARGVVGDFRAPDVLRFGFAPLYVRFVDAWDAAGALAEVLSSHAHERPEFRGRAAVT